MNNKTALPRSVFSLLKITKRTCLTLLLLVALPVASFAQETTGSLRGTVTGPDGSPLTGAAVVVNDTRTGTSRTMTTNASGGFSLSGMRIGGPYEVSIASSDHASQTVTDIYVTLGDTFTFTVALSSDTIEEIVVTAQQLGAVQVAVGPSATFTLQDLQDAPAVNRSITDVVKIDSRMYVDEGGNRGDAIWCNGAHPRFNSLTIDGVRMNDQFGLNTNGFPTTRQPFSFDAIQQVAVEMAPFDVQYGGFTACNINAVTKSGTNEFHGSAFYDYTDDSMTGDVLDGEDIDLGSFDESRYGISFGGPILQDKLFFFLAYEKLDGVDIFPRGPSDGEGAAVAVQGVTQAQLDSIAQIAQTTYGYDVGAVVPSLPVEDEKFLLRLDYDINEDHRAAYTYMYNDGFNISESDGDANEFEFSNHYYERGAELKSHVLQLLSNWTENFSTEARISKNELDNRQVNIGGTNANGDVFGEVQVRTYGPTGARATVYLGADDSRHSNDLDWDTLGFKLTGAYTLGNHTISGGWERDQLDVFNLFIQETEGEFEFEALCSDTNPDGCIAQFAAGSPDDITYENAAPSNNPDDGAALWSYNINSLYLQDEFLLGGGDITVVAGLRYDWYTSDDVPTENQNFIDRNGYTNARNFDGISLLQPRLGINWEITEDLSLRGGVGLYSGGNPNVWLSNNYSNNGITQAQARRNYIGTGETLLPGDPGGLTSQPNTGDGAPLWNVPQSMFDEVGSGTPNSGVNAIDPDFNVPSSWKFALGGSWHFDAPWIFGNDYRLDVDYQLSTMDDAAIIRDATLEQIGNAADGRPIYRNIDRSDHGDGVTDFGCYTDATGNVLDPTSSTCSQRLFNSDYILDNTKSGDSEQQSITLALSKTHDWGLDWTIAYTHIESEDVSPMNSSVAFSNYAQMALSDPNDPGSANSNYLIPDRFTLRLNFRRAWFGDNMTKFTVFASRNQGRPFSYTFNDGGFTFGDIIDDRHLLYVPTGPGDPNVVFDPGFDQTAFFDFLAAEGLNQYAGGTAPRNFTQGPWWTKVDFKVEQEFPGFGDDHRASAFLLIQNIGNLLNDEWGVLKEASFPRYQGVVDVPNSGPPFFNDAGLDAQGRYLFDGFTPPAAFVPNQAASLYEIRFGIRYSF
jgi:hypothetical protein